MTPAAAARFRDRLSEYLAAVREAAARSDAVRQAEAARVAADQASADALENLAGAAPWPVLPGEYEPSSGVQRVTELFLTLPDGTAFVLTRPSSGTLSIPATPTKIRWVVAEAVPPAPAAD